MSTLLTVTVSHPGGGPFVCQTARAFADAGALARLVTTVVDRPSSPAQKSVCRAAGWAGFDLARQLARRAVPDVPTDKVVSYPWRELARQAAARADRSGVWGDRVWEWAEKGFDRWVARHGLDGATAVYGYEHACRATMEAARRRGLFCVYEVPAPEHHFTAQILRAELDRYPEMLDAYQRRVRRPSIHGRRNDRRKKEWKAAHLVIANSEFTRASFAGYEDPGDPNRGLDKVSVIPLGAPPLDPAGAGGGSAGTGPLRVLWAGSFSIRKGAHYLTAAWDKAGLSGAVAALDVYGAVTLPAGARKAFPAAFRFHGSVSRGRLYDAYLAADVCVLPSLCDGFGMTVTEALSRGLPVVTTPRTGAAGLIRDKVNGLVVPAADAVALSDALGWCAANRQALREMRPAALAAAAGWQWADYRAALVRAVAGRYAKWSGGGDG